eukprot:314197-Pyramimonas_sp.AAC.1
MSLFCGTQRTVWPRDVRIASRGKNSQTAQLWLPPDCDPTLSALRRCAVGGPDSPDKSSVSSACANCCTVLEKSSFGP